MKASRRRLTTSDKVFRIIVFILMSFFAFTYIFLLLWMVLGSFRSLSSFQ